MTHPRRRTSDQPWKARVLYQLRTTINKLLFFTKHEHWYRDVWLLVVTGIALIGVALAIRAVQQIQEGRRIGQGITCSALSAVSQTGRDVISHRGPFTKFFVHQQISQREADAIGRTYARVIAKRVRFAHGQALVRPDGSIDCRKLLLISKIPEPESGP